MITLFDGNSLHISLFLSLSLSFSLSLPPLSLSPLSLSLPSLSLPLSFSSSPFQGLIRDAKRRYRYYLSDFRDAFWDTSTNKCSLLALLSTIAVIIFIYFVNIAPAITFGQVLSDITDGKLVRHLGGHYLVSMNK